MPPDLLTRPAPQIATAVEAVLAGTPLATAAADLGVNAAALADAVDTYRAAGLAALQHRHEHTWFQARIAMPDWATAEAAFAAHLAPHLDQLDNGNAGWWYLRKHPHWRLRVRTSDHDAVTAVLDDLTAGAIRSWHPGIYEPEAAAFGHAAMDTVHDLFCADSRGVLTYARQQTPALGRRELSLLLIRALQQHAGLDWFESGDTFDRITHLHPAPAAAYAARIDELASRMRPLLAIPVEADSPLFAPAGPVAFAMPWLEGFIHAGRRLGDNAAAGHLDRGLRTIIAHIMIFHWNRLGLSAEAQGILAHAAKAAILPRG